MRNILFVALTAAGLLALPAFAQVEPSASSTPTRTGAAVAGAAASTNADTPAVTSGTQPLGLGGLLKQTQAGSNQTRMGGGSVDDAQEEGAGPLGSLDAKARAKKARAHGH